MADTISEVLESASSEALESASIGNPDVRQHKTAPRYLTIPDWPNYYDWPPIGGLRHLRFHQDTNGFAPAFKTVGSRVLIDADEFWQIVAEQGGGK